MNFILYIYADISYRFSIKKQRRFIIYFIPHYSNCIKHYSWMKSCFFGEVTIIHWRLISTVYRCGLPSLCKVLKYKYIDASNKYALCFWQRLLSFFHALGFQNYASGNQKRLTSKNIIDIILNGLEEQI